MGSINAEFLHLDGTKVVERIIGIGGTGIVIQQGQYALKIPRISRDIEVDGVPVTNGRLTPVEGDYDERPDRIRSLEDEKAIYRRLDDHHGIVRCYNLSSAHHSIQMALMENRDLRHYLAKARPGRKMQLSWLTEMARTMAYIHYRRVIVADIRLDNLLLDDNLAVKFTDFGESTMMPLDWNLEGTDDLGFSILSDIGQFGAVMYEIVTGREYKFVIWNAAGKSPAWPRRDDLAPTSDIWLGHIIEKCWTRGFRSAEDLAIELDKESVS
jgi:serine/threonine protein kinase